MRTTAINTYTDFVEYGRNYLPFVSMAGTLVVTNISVNGHITGPKAKNRLIIETIVIYNRKSFAAVFTTCLSCQGMRQRWVYFRNGKRVTYPRLTWDEKRKVVVAWWVWMIKNNNPEHVNPPTIRWKSVPQREDWKKMSKAAIVSDIARARRNGS